MPDAPRRGKAALPTVATATCAWCGRSFDASGWHPVARGIDGEIRAFCSEGCKREGVGADG